MTKEEAIKEFESDLKWAKLNRYPYISKQKIEALKMAIEALEQESCEDTISRLEVFKQIDQWAIGNREYLPTNAIHYLAKRMLDIPPVIPQQKTGHWINKSKQSDCGVNFIHIECSECGEPSGLNNTYAKYCPWCGVKMMKEEDKDVC